MNRYRILGRIGDGAYGSVMLAIKLDSGEKVAIKKYVVRFQFIRHPHAVQWIALTRLFLVQDETQVPFMGRSDESSRS